MTHSYVWHGLKIFVTWLIHVCDMTRSSVWYDSFIHVIWLIHMYDMYSCTREPYVCVHICQCVYLSVRYNGEKQGGRELDMTHSSPASGATDFHSLLLPAPDRISQKSSRYTKSTVWNDYRADFWEILSKLQQPPLTDPFTAACRAWPNFNLLLDLPLEPSFEKFQWLYAAFHEIISLLKFWYTKWPLIYSIYYILINHYGLLKCVIKLLPVPDTNICTVMGWLRLVGSFKL